MSVKRIRNDDLREFLKSSRNAIVDMVGTDWYWQIDGVTYPERQALKLAEYCMLTGQPLTSIATVEGALNMARRMAAAEEEIADLKDKHDRLKDDIDRLMGTRHWHWWRHG